MNKTNLIKETETHKKHENCKSCKNCSCSNNLNKLLRPNIDEIIDLEKESKEDENIIHEANEK